MTSLKIKQLLVEMYSLNILNEISAMDIKIYDSGEVQRVRLHCWQMSLKLYMNIENPLPTLR